jgi:D-beta-D-heptose 7-phosphate kinase / D-beta-D-heptose 1-phosphate adenosyltransferase
MEAWGLLGASAVAMMREESRKLLRGIVHQFKGVRVAVLGDPMLDYYHFGHVTRISPEAPVPVFVEDKIDLRDGGAGNVVENLRGLGCDVYPLFPPAPYSMKHRYFVGSQQVGMRIDRDKDHSQQVPERPAFSTMGDVEPLAFVISDYGKGWCSPGRCKSVTSWAAKRNVPVVVDPKGNDWSKYEGAQVVCPNDKEYAEWDRASFFPEIIVHKQGPKGLDLIQRGAPLVHFAANARQVFDVTGAGDTVVAVLAAALAVRAEYAIAAELANIAAGIVVGQVGTTPVSAGALLAELQ